MYRKIYTYIIIKKFQERDKCGCGIPVGGGISCDFTSKFHQKDLKF
jgi:hypothetical protein